MSDMDIRQAQAIVTKAMEQPIDTWPGFSPANIPLAIFGDQDSVYLNHPAPPDERPAGWMAATAIEINGVLTATLPLWMVNEPAAIMPLVYHECFHVYQQTGGFSPDDRKIDSNRARAFYPELDPSYRALCRAESEIHRSNNRPYHEKVTLLAVMASRRYKILSQYQDSLLLEQQAERQEGPAYYIQQQVGFLLNQATIPQPDERASYARVYHCGAAVCRLLSQSGAGWHLPIANGLSPTESLINRYGQNTVDLTDMHLDEKTTGEIEYCQRVKTEIATFTQGNVIRLKIPADVPMRGFNPMSVLSLGDGRLLHTGIYFMQSPSGSLMLKQGMLLEDFISNQLIFPAVPVQFSGDQLKVSCDSIEINLTGVRQSAECSYALE
jgi:hypothetical protein